MRRGTKPKPGVSSTQEINLGADYNREQLEFMMAMDLEKRRSHLNALPAVTILRVARRLGYKRVARPTTVPSYDEIKNKILAHRREERTAERSTFRSRRLAVCKLHAKPGRPRGPRKPKG